MAKKKVSKKATKKAQSDKPKAPRARKPKAQEPSAPPEPPGDVVKRSTFERELEVNLTREEVEAVSSRLVHTLREHDIKELEFKEQAKRNRGMLQDLQTSVRKLSDSVSGKTELREITCERELNYSTGRVTDRRTDTGEILSERDMTEKERQRDLELTEEFGDEDPVPPEGEGDADEEFGDDSEEDDSAPWDTDDESDSEDSEG